ncbi:MAG: DUF3810 family protein [Clostridia bacterium]|nr:DUF3810 family protein [Clostridia bacterium]
MYKRKRLERRLIKQAIAIVSLALFLLILSLLKRSLSVSEWISTHISRAYIAVFGRIIGILPFSLYELTIIALIIFAVFFIIRLVKCFARGFWRSALSAILSLVIVGVSFGCLYITTASFSYNRSEVDIPMTSAVGDAVSEEDFKAIALYCAEQLEELSQQVERKNGVVICPYTFNELSELIRHEYERLDSDYFNSYTPKAKRVLFSEIMSQMRITGLFFAPYDEANINTNCFPCELAHTMAHEMAHGKGVMNEDSANLMGYYILLTSDDPFLKYSGYYQCFYKITSRLYLINGGKEVYFNIYDEIIGENYNNDIAADMKIWSKYHMLADISEFFNDLYLKINGESDGTQSYYVPPVIVDSGETGDDGEIIYKIQSYNNVQRMVFQLYFDGEL